MDLKVRKQFRYVICRALKNVTLSEILNISSLSRVFWGLISKTAISRNLSLKQNRVYLVLLSASCAQVCSRSSDMSNLAPTRQRFVADRSETPRTATEFAPPP